MYPEKMKQKHAVQEEREIEVMRSLRHRNVVELLDVVVRTPTSKAAGRAPYMFLIFEFAEGGDFASYLKSQPGRKLSEAKTRHWMMQLRDGLFFLSQQSILHRGESWCRRASGKNTRTRMMTHYFPLSIQI